MPDFVGYQWDISN